MGFQQVSIARVLFLILFLSLFVFSLRLPDEFAFRFRIYSRLDHWKKYSNKSKLTKVTTVLSSGNHINKTAQYDDDNDHSGDIGSGDDDNDDDDVIKGIFTKSKQWDVASVVCSEKDEVEATFSPFEAIFGSSHDDHASRKSNKTPLDTMYMYRNGRLMFNGECIGDSSTVPPRILREDMIKDAKLIKVVDIESKSDHRDHMSFDYELNKCLKSDKAYKHVKFWHLNYALEDIVICTTQSKQYEYDVPFKIISRSLVITLSHFRPQENKLILQMTNPVTKCDENRSYDHHRQKFWKNNQKKLWFQDDKMSCDFEWIRDPETCSNEGFLLNKSSQTSSSSSTSTSTGTTSGNGRQLEKKVCIFLHGSGNWKDNVGDPVSEFPQYWGDVHLYTPQCSKRVFAREETNKQGWEDRSLQESYCRIALTGQISSDKFIRNKIIFTHSMGGLALAAAIKNGYCDIDKRSTSWYSIQSPFMGTKAITALNNVCAGKVNFLGFLPGTILQSAGASLGYCNLNTKKPFKSYLSLSSKNGRRLSTLVDIAKDRLKGAMCGIRPQGLAGNKYSVALSTLSSFVRFDEDNDGMVPVSSCSAPTSPHHEYELSHESDHYHVVLNHADGTCRNGDGWFGADRKPCSYFSNKN